MTVPTIRPQKSIFSSPVFVYVLALVGAGIIVFLGINVINNFGSLKGKTALSVTVLDGEAEVYLNDDYLGTTPYESKDIRSGENKVTVKNDNILYEVNLNFQPNTEVFFERDLGVSDTFSSGQNFWLEKDDSESVLSIISDPSETTVYIDNTEVGKTPYSTDTLTEGEYDLRLEKVGYESQTSRTQIQSGYKLNVAAKLFPQVVSLKVDLLEDSENMYDVYSSNVAVSSNTARWVQAIIHWNKTRGVNLMGYGVNKELVFDFFLDYDGNLFDKNGNLFNADEGVELSGKIAYLRLISDSVGLSTSAKVALENLSVVSGKKVKILPTGLGWLRVRAEPSIGSTEVTKVNVGEEFLVLEERSGWAKIRISDDVVGWVSSTFVESVE